jgi:hypothetical protein
MKRKWKNEEVSKWGERKGVTLFLGYSNFDGV